MANSRSSAKRARQNERRNLRNSSKYSAMRTQMKKTDKLISDGVADVAAAAYAELVPALDREAQRGLLHRNKAARHKSRLNKRLRAVVS